MDKTALVDKQIDEGKKLIEGLDKSKFKLVGALWYYNSNSGEWKLLLVSPLVDVIGPKQSYDVILAVLQDLKLSFELLTNISVLSPKNSLIQLLGRVVHTEGISQIRFTRNTINGVFIEDALIYRLC